MAKCKACGGPTSRKVVEDVCLPCRKAKKSIAAFLRRQGFAVIGSGKHAAGTSKQEQEAGE